MSRARSPDRVRALQIWLDSCRIKTPKVIAHELGISDSMVRKWKSQDKWDERPEPKPKRRGAPKGNKNAEGNKGGIGGPEKNGKAVKHGFFRKYFPSDVADLMEEIDSLEPIDILWSMIRTQFAAIVRAQSIMHVRDRDDLTKVLKSDGDKSTSWEYQHAADKQATFMKAQSGAMTSVLSLIRRYDDMCSGLGDEAKRLAIDKMKLELKTLGAKVNDDKGKLEDFF